MQDWRRWLSGALLVAFALALIVRRDDLVAAGREIARLSPRSAGMLALLAAAATWASGSLAAAVSPGLGLTRGVMVQQATLAANNTGIGSGPIALGVRISMLRSWGLDEVAIGIAVLGVNVVAALKLWVAALAVSVLALGGAADGTIERWVFHAVIAVSIVVLAVTVAATWLALRHPAPLRWIAARIDAVLRRAARRSPRFGRLAGRIEPYELLERLRVDAALLARVHGARIFAAGAAEQAVLVALPVVIVRAYGIDPQTLSTAQVLIVFVLVRLAASLTAIPGGIGVTEVGLAALLARFGTPDAPALASVLTFRAITFLLPIAVGAVSFAAWRHRLPLRRAAPERQPEPVGG